MIAAPVGTAVQFAELDGADWWAAIIIDVGLGTRRKLAVCDSSGAWSTQASVHHEDDAGPHESRWRLIPGSS